MAVTANCMVTVDFPTPAGPSNNVVEPVDSPPASIRSRTFATPLGKDLPRELIMVCFGGNQAGVNDHAALNDFVVVEALAEVRSADLGHIEFAAAPRTVLGQRPLENHVAPPTKLSGWTSPNEDERSSRSKTVACRLQQRRTP